MKVVKYKMLLRHLKNLFFIFSSKILSTIFAFIAQILIARFLIQEDYGTISFYIILINILSAAIGFGLGNFWLRRFAVEGYRAIRWLEPTLISIVLLMLIAIPIYILVPLYSLGLHSLLTSIVLLPLLVYQGLGSVVTAIFQIQNDYKRLSWYMTIKNLVFLISALILVISDYNSFIFTYGVLSLILLGYSLSVIKVFNNSMNKNLDVATQKPKLSNVFGSAWPFGVQGILYMLYYQVDIVIITLLLGTTFTGLYNAAFTIISLVFVFPSILFQIYLLPKSNIWIAKKDHKKIDFIRNKVTIAAFLFGLLILILLYLLAEDIVTMLYGHEFSDSVPLFKILILTIPFRFISDSLGVLFATEKMMSNKVYVQGGGALVNVVLNIILIIRIGVLGAAISTVFTEIMVVILMYYYSLRIKRELLDN